MRLMSLHLLYMKKAESDVKETQQTNGIDIGIVYMHELVCIIYINIFIIYIHIRRNYYHINIICNI